MDRHTQDGPSCMTVMTVRDPSPKGLHIFSQVSYDGHLQWTVVTVTVRPVHTVMLVRDPLSGFSIYTESKYTTTDLTTVRHSHDEPSPGPSCVTVYTAFTYYFHYFISYGFALSCLPLLVLIVILCRYYLLWHPSKTEPTHAGDQSLSPRLHA